MNLISPILFSTLLFVGMLICLEVGRRLGLRRIANNPEGSSKGLGVVEGAFFALLSLLAAFSFSGATSRFDQRRALIVEEANDIGTAYLRVDLLAQDAQPAMRDLFRRYMDSRLTVHQKLPDFAAANAELTRANDLQNQIWKYATANSTAPGSHPDAGKLLLPAINSMIDITNTRMWASLTHPPRIIYAMLFLMGLLCSVIAGSSLAAAKPPAWVHMVGFALLISLSMFFILEIEYPRQGFIDIERYDQALVDVRQTMK